MPSLTRILLFLLLGFVDLSLSWLLFAHQDGSTRVTEGNPLASRFFANHGWVGLAGLKACCSVAVLGICTVVARYRKALADRVLYLGVVVVAGVIVYSCALTTYLGVTQTPFAQHTPAPVFTPEETERVFRILRRRITPQVLRGDCTLASAVRDLDARLRISVPPVEVREMKRKNPGIGYVRCLHSIVLRDALLTLQTRNPEDAPFIASRLLAEYRSCWRESPPVSVRRLAESFEFVVPPYDPLLFVPRTEEGGRWNPYSGRPVGRLDNLSHVYM